MIKFLVGFLLGIFASFYITPEFKNLISEYFTLIIYYIEN